MKSSLAIRIGVFFSAAVLGCTSLMVAQPAAGPLSIQGLDQFVVAGIRSRAMGGTSIASVRDASALFSNPAALSHLAAFEIRAGGLFGAASRSQSQEWVPMRPLPGISVLFEGRTGTIKTPDSLGVPGLPLSSWSRLQKQYDTIEPNWSRRSSRAQPLLLAAAMPLTVAGINIAAGIGVAQMIDLDHFYQNNNSMSPYLGQERPDQMLFTVRTDTVHVKWHQYTRNREGSVYGIAPGISAEVLPGLTFGAAAAFLTGSSDDKEDRVERGLINIAVSNGVASNFMVDTVYYYQTKTGKSTYAGNIFTFGLHMDQERFSIGVTINPPMTLTRTWDRDVKSLDTTRNVFPVRVDSLTSRSYHESGKDELRFPLSYGLGIVLKPASDWIIAFDYVMRNLADAELTSQAGSGSSRPWVNSKATMRLGAEYRPTGLLALRGGYRQDIQPFSPDGSAIINEPAAGEVYSLGAGFLFGNFGVDIAYEYSRLKYQDIYQSNVNYNTREFHKMFVEVAHRL
jgi:long-subunit fatty acid transport protein